MNDEVIYLLGEALQGRQKRAGKDVEERARAQAKAWALLAGRWQSECSARKEIAALYAARRRRDSVVP